MAAEAGLPLALPRQVRAQLWQTERARRTRPGAGEQAVPAPLCSAQGEGDETALEQKHLLSVSQLPAEPKDGTRTVRLCIMLTEYGFHFPLNLNVHFDFQTPVLALLC